MQSGDIDAMLRALAERGPALRAAGFSSVTLPDGTSFTLRAAAPSPPVVAAAPAGADDDDEPEDDAKAEARALKDAEAHWEKAMSRLLASSGASLPPFPGLEAYRKSLPVIGSRH